MLEPALPILSISMLVPFLSAICIIFCVSRNIRGQKETYAIYLAAFASLLTFIITLYLLINFDQNNIGFQYVERYNWVETIGLEFYVGVDGLSIYLICLSSLLTLICVITSIFNVKKNIKELLIYFLLLETCCIGAFSALNMLLFYIFFEIILIPMYLIIGIWGGENRIYAAIKFFLYTFFGSVALLIGIVYIFSQVGTLSMIELSAQLPLLPLGEQQLLWMAIFLSCAIKIPMIPLHTWLPDTHVQAPTTGSVILAGILLKLGSYALLRILLPMLPLACEYFASYVIWMSSLTIIYASLLAFSQNDMKKMIAYSSIAHMGYVTASIFTFSIEGMSGAVFQMISHGLISAALFLMVGMLYERYHTRMISDYQAIASHMPVLATLFMITMLAAIGVPGLSGFIGEVLSIFSVFRVNPIAGIICAFGMVAGAIYMLNLYKDVMFGIADSTKSVVKDLAVHEKVAVIPLVLLMIWIGIVPNYVLSIIRIPISNLAIIYNNI